jgi:hypothetical protein
MSTMVAIIRPTPEHHQINTDPSLVISADWLFLPLSSSGVKLLLFAFGSFPAPNIVPTLSAAAPEPLFSEPPPPLCFGSPQASIPIPSSLVSCSCNVWREKNKVVGVLKFC